MYKIIIILSFAFITNILFAQTVLPTIFSEDTFLRAENSPYLVENTVTINSGVTVQFEKSCTILFNEGKRFNVSGTLKLIGEQNDSIKLITNVGATYWGPITTDSGNLIFDYVILQNPKRIISASHGSVKINNSRISAVIGAIGEDGIALHNADTLIILNSLLESDADGGKIDAIDADGISYGNISNNIIKNWPDDGVDIGTSSHNVIINNNNIRNVDFGISVGESSVVYAERNVIYDSYGGLQSHDGATLTADHNTIYKIVRALMPHHGTQTNTGGTLTVTNTIMYKATSADYTVQTNSVLDVSYSISSKNVLPGDNNLFGNPLFVDTTNFNLYLSDNSPCIDSGDPNYTGIYNGLHTDMGAFEYDYVSSENINVNSENNLLIYPNPAKNNLQLIINNEQLINTNIVIYDVFGRKVKQFEITNLKLRIKVSDLQEGIYFVKFNDKMVKFIKD